MKKLDLITLGYAKQSLDRSSREHARMLEYAGVVNQLHMVVFTTQSDGYGAPLVIDNLTIHPTNSRTRFGMAMRAIGIIRRILKTQKGEWIVSSQDPLKTSLIAKIALMGMKARHHIQVHTDVLNTRVLGSGISAQLWRRYAIAALRRAGCIRVVSERIKSSLVVHGVSGSAIRVLPIHADLEKFLTVGSDRQYERIGAFKLLFIGRFSEEKNIPLILAACKAARASGADIKLTCIGDGPLREELETLGDELGLEDRVRLLPWTHTVHEAMTEADALVLASSHEGWGMVIVEAMAAGLPVIMTDVGCAHEMLEHEKHGLVVPVGDVQRFAEAVVDLAADRKRAAEFGIAAHKKVAATMPDTDEYLSKWQASFTCETD